MNRFELRAAREGDARARVSPAASVAAASVGLAFATAHPDVRRAEIVANHKVSYEVDTPDGRERREFVRTIPLVTVTRTGPQEFANGRRAWFDMRDRTEQRHAS